MFPALSGCAFREFLGNSPTQRVFPEAFWMVGTFVTSAKVAFVICAAHSVWVLLSEGRGFLSAEFCASEVVERFVYLAMGSRASLLAPDSLVPLERSYFKCFFPHSRKILFKSISLLRLRRE